MIGVDIFKKHGLTLTQKRPQDLLDNEARWRKRGFAKKLYWELCVRKNGVYALSTCDYRDFHKESAAGFGAVMIESMIDQAFKSLERHHAFNRGIEEVYTALKALPEGAEIPDELHSKAAELYDVGQPVTYNGVKHEVVARRAPFLDLVAQPDGKEVVSVKGAMVAPYDPSQVKK